ncbi:MAG: ABC transporter permease [Actinomycetota bacterium]|nr:ABC transporter permease [Actinomycetota bacterium]
MRAVPGVGPRSSEEVGEEIDPLSPQAEAPAARPGRPRRALVASYAVTAFLLMTLNFFLPRALPGDPISALIDTGSPGRVHDEALREQLEQYYGLDRPLLEQYSRYLVDLARGDLGTSIRYNGPVTDLLQERLPWTLLLVSTSLSLAVAGGWAAGIHSGWRRSRPVDRGLLVLFLSVHSFPVFFVGSLVLFVFSVKLGWFPLAGARTPFLEDVSLPARVADIAHHLVLPAAVLALSFVTSQYLNMRASMVTQLGEDHLLLARAKGLPERRIKYRYAARNALLPVVTLTAVHVSFAVTASILVETVFSYQGVGRLVFEAVAYRDYPALQGCFLVLSLVVLAANFLADTLYRRLDPRTAA